MKSSPLGLPLFTQCLSFKNTGLEKHMLDAPRQLESLTSLLPLWGDIKEHAFIKGRCLRGPSPASEQQPTFFPLKKIMIIFFRKRKKTAFNRKRVGAGQTIDQGAASNRISELGWRWGHRLGAGTPQRLRWQGRGSPSARSKPEGPV